MSKKLLRQEFNTEIIQTRDGNYFLRFENNYGAIVFSDGQWTVELIYWTGAHTYLSWGSITHNSYAEAKIMLDQIKSIKDEPDLDAISMEPENED